MVSLNLILVREYIVVVDIPLAEKSVVCLDQTYVAYVV